MFAVKDFFSYVSIQARKKKNQLPTSYLQEEYKIRRWVFVLQVAQFKESKGFFFQQATYKGSVPCALNQEFLFFGHKYFGLEAAHLG
jgi:hypothetical protein